MKIVRENEKSKGKNPQSVQALRQLLAFCLVAVSASAGAAPRLNNRLPSAAAGPVPSCVWCSLLTGLLVAISVVYMYSLRSGTLRFLLRSGMTGSRFLKPLTNGSRVPDR